MADFKLARVAQPVHRIPEYLILGGEQNYCDPKTHRMAGVVGLKPPLIRAFICLEWLL